MCYGAQQSVYSAAAKRIAQGQKLDSLVGVNMGTVKDTPRQFALGSNLSVPGISAPADISRQMKGVAYG